ncbi:MAG: DUF1345 domain-containing protein [Rhizobiales bacterium]|nr:DUF1345 domain-containing protein [Hyphomicrobiales bacterium]
MKSRPTQAKARAKQSADDIFLRLQRMPKAVRIVYARPRLFASVLIGFLSLVFMPADWRATTRLLLAWDISITLYLYLAYQTVFSCGQDYIRRQAAMQDDGRFLILILTLVAAFASVAAIVMELGVKPQRAPQLTFAVTTIILSWLAVHTTFALHYAHEYYRCKSGHGLKFPGGGDPDYWDFVYFSFVVGMTAQVSDVGITDKIIRRTATAHGITSFFFNTALLALMVNIAASAI